MKKIFKYILLTLPILLTSCKKTTIKIVYLPDEDNTNLISTEYKKVFILAGQSNASGMSHNSELEKYVSNEQYNEYKDGYNNVLISYNTDTISSIDFVPVSLDQGCAKGYFGPEVGFGEYFSKYSNETIYVIKYARGGTRLEGQWLEDNRDRGYLYNELIDFVNTQMQKLDNAKIVGCMWMQGESDCIARIKYHYYDNELSFISYLREDLKDYIIDEGMVFADAGIADNWDKYYLINNAKVDISNLSNLNVYFSTSENGLRNDNEPTNNIDRAHYDSLSEIRLGKSFGLVLKLKLNEIIK